MKILIRTILPSLVWLVASLSAPAQTAPPSTNAAAVADEPKEKLKYSGTPMDLVLKDYSDKTGRTILMAPGVPNVALTMNSQGFLTRTEWLQAVEAVLSMHGVALIREGEKFLKVVPSKSARQESMKIREDTDRHEVPESDELISQVIRLQHIEIAEADKAIRPLLHAAFGQINTLERVNSIMITDSAANINRILQIIKHIDLPMEAREEPNIVQIRYAKAADIKRKLEEIIAQSQAEQQKKAATVARPAQSGGPVMERVPVIPGVIRPPVPTPVVPQPDAAGSDDVLALAERGIIRGKVHMVADDRTNILIIITRPENMKFFERIVNVLDVETTPDVMVKALRLEYAEAESVASTLNTLIGAAKKDAAAAPAGTGRERSPDDRVAALRDYVAQAQQERTAKVGAEQKSKLGELSSDNIKILPDKRTNSLLIMASRADLAAIEEVVRSMDMMLSQVLIETVIMEVQLGDSIQTGVDWVQRAMVAYDQKAAAGGSPLFSFAGGGGGGGDYSPQNATALGTAGSISPGAGLTYYMTYFGLNLDAVLHMAAGDSRTKIISSPVIVTHDNTEAIITAGETRYFYKGKKWVGTTTEGRYEDDVEQKEIGLHLTVKPHINEKKLVVMEIQQKIEELAEEQKIGDTAWPTVLKRDMKASVSVRNRDTIVLGGLVRHTNSQIERGIPYLRKIPLLGRLFGYDKGENNRGEIIVFITPYVLNTPEEIEEETRRRQEATATGELWKKSWSQSRIAEGRPAPVAAPAPAVSGAPVAPVAPETKPAVIRTEERPRPAAPAAVRAAAPAAAPAPSAAPAAAVDPALLRFIESEERKYGAALENADRLIEKELESLGTGSAKP